MLVDDDLPDGWRIIHSPMPNGDEIERALIRSERADAVAHSWDEIEREDNGQRVLLRMAPPEVEDGRIVNDGAKVTAVVVLPDQSSDRVTAAQMRFPLGQIEGAANRRNQAARPMIASLLGSIDYEPPAPIGRPDGTDGFYARVAMLWRFYEEDPNPTERLRQACGTSLPTAQRWVAEARRRRLLPPGRRGRAK
ncbi:hypothetical protein [Herbiconiux solani]|uniref:hypothetical protein n=1 Tax=Herbiconiux solani TaxID=661329 RepID=UPI0012EEA7AB|nr:hypothetical protein [Herbiconiux solani]